MTDNNNKYPVSAAKINELLKYIDILVDGEFDATENNDGDGFGPSVEQHTPAGGVGFYEDQRPYPEEYPDRTHERVL